MSLANAQEVSIRNIEALVNPVFVPDIFFDLAPSTAAVLDALKAVPSPAFNAGPIDVFLPDAPAMFPMLVWRVSDRWDAQHQSFRLGTPGVTITTVYVDIGAHTWSRFFPLLRDEPGAILVCLEPTRTSFTELYRRLKLDYNDLLHRVLALPVAAALEPRTSFGFQTLHTNDFWGGECNSLLKPDDESDLLPECTARGSEEIVPVMSLDVVMEAVFRGLDTLQASAGPLLEIKVDAQGADLAIVETLASSRWLLSELRQVQLEVTTKPLYLKQPLKHEILERMQRLGLELRLDMKTFVDGGPHEVVDGCAIHVGDAAGTEDCFFARAQGSR